MRNERVQTTGEEIANTLTHTIGSHFGAAMLAILVWQGVSSETHVAWKVTSAAVFGASVILLYAISSAYHLVSHAPAKRILQILDHMAIFFLIAGSYTPFCLVSLRAVNSPLAWSIFAIEWGLAFVGVAFKVLTTGRYRFVSTLSYLIMGWVAILAFMPLARALQGPGTMWLVLGGGLYTVGCVFYLWTYLPYSHMVWHLFVLSGTVCHFFCILWHVMA